MQVKSNVSVPFNESLCFVFQNGPCIISCYWNIIEMLLRNELMFQILVYVSAMYIFKQMLWVSVT
jgi:hypothetical protein